MKSLKILVACEESQTICKEFRKRGHEAYSCDILDCSGGCEQWHIKDDVLNHINKEWDLIIAHPPCTFLTRAGCRWLFQGKKLNQERYKKGLEAKDFFLKFVNLENCKYVAVENPNPHKIFDMPKESQIIQPFQFGHKITKRTFLWLKGLPPLKYTKVIEPEYYRDRKGIRHSVLTNWDSKKASKTFTGIAKAMAEQWGDYILEEGRRK